VAAPVPQRAGVRGLSRHAAPSGRTCLSLRRGEPACVTGDSAVRSIGHPALTRAARPPWLAAAEPPGAGRGSLRGVLRVVPMSLQARPAPRPRNAGSPAARQDAERRRMRSGTRSLSRRGPAVREGRRALARRPAKAGASRCERTCLRHRGFRCPLDRASCPHSRRSPSVARCRGTPRRRARFATASPRAAMAGAPPSERTGLRHRGFLGPSGRYGRAHGRLEAPRMAKDAGCAR
jgi:hypothetical protein